MEIKVHRYFEQDKDRTFGLLSVDCEFMGHTLEDEYRDVKVKSETRIPAGRYQVKFNENANTNMTKKYRDMFPWFTFHLWLQDVPNFEWIYMHVGNYDTNSAGCILIGSDADYDKKMITASRTAFEKFYKKVQKALHDNEEVWVTVKDEGEWL